LWFNGTTSTTSETYYNVFSNNADNSIDVNATQAGKIYNNVLYGSLNESFILQGTSGSAVTFKNNIVSEWKAGANAAAVGVANPTVIGNSTFDNNLYYKAGDSNCCHLLYVAKTLAQWKTDASQDANSLNSSPAFVSSSDYHLQTGSPAIDTGVAVGLTQDFAGNPIVGNPDIGAYESGSSTPTGVITHFGNY
jgi:hypothetical protein